MSETVDSSILDHSPGRASSIKAIDRASVHRICSGQVVLTLATAVKELVENSIDAGATIIEVRLKDHGAELVEVIDNGCGVKEENFEGLTLKHHTSKLRDFSDLVNVETFGFRGEALSSLCALSNLSVVTCHKDAAVGTRLEYDPNGRLVSRTPCARQPGTTVSLGQLFLTLPVRHKEFHRNIKKEFSKMVHVLNAYCIMSTRLRVTCTNQVGSGKKSIVVSINGNETVKENITNIFGPKQVQNLIAFKQVPPSEAVCSEFNIKVPETELFTITGHISSSEHGFGRGSSDRQFYFINRRPCDLTKVSRVVNEVYHAHNRHQYPFVVLDISLGKESVDVNVTPDKRQIFISEEKLLLATIKTSLIQMFEPISSVYQVNQGQGKTASTLITCFRPKLDPRKETNTSPLLKAKSCPEWSKKSSLTSTLANLKRSFSSAFAKGENEVNSTDKEMRCKDQKQRRLDNFLKIESPQPNRRCDALPVTSQSDNSTSDTVDDSERKALTPILSTPPESAEVNSLGSPRTSLIWPNEHPPPSSPVSIQSSPSWFQSPDLRSPQPCMNMASREGSDVTPSVMETPESIPSPVTPNITDVSPAVGGLDKEESPAVSQLETRESTPEEPIPVSEDTGPQDTDILRERIEQKSDQPTETHVPHRDGVKITRTEYDEAEDVRRQSRPVSFSISQLQQLMKQRQEKLRDDSGEKCRTFRASISPSDNQAAEEELRKEITKDMFPRMEILGQFNLGFIIAKLGSDLFIIDQHATDEKYNFEMLQRHTVIRSQKLIQPQRLELTAANSSVLIDNIDIFRTNGFDFEIDEEEPITSRVKLTAMPVSKNWTFGKDDIEELIFMLSDSPGVLCRPSRVRMMFASRACRKSIMVGTALNKTEMRKVVNHMGEIEHPWNCPHGRPTMRHLINLDCLQDLENS